MEFFGTRFTLSIEGQRNVTACGPAYDTERQARWAAVHINTSKRSRRQKPYTYVSLIRSSSYIKYDMKRMDVDVYRNESGNTLMLMCPECDTCITVPATIHGKKVKPYDFVDLFCYDCENRWEAMA